MTIRDRWEILKVHLRFPGWKREIRTREFEDWLRGQPAHIHAKCASIWARDAIEVIKLFRTR